MFLLSETTICYLLCSLRFAGLLFALPHFESIFGIAQRLALASILGAIFFSSSTDLNSDTLSIIFQLPLQFLFGFLVGLPMLLVFEAAGMVSELFESSRGSNVSLMADPFFGVSQSAFTTLVRIFVFSVILSTNLFLKLFLEVIHSLQDPLIFNLEHLPNSFDLGVLITRIIATLSVAFSTAATLVTIFLLVECIAAYLSRIVSNLSIQQENGVVKILVTIFILYLITMTGGAAFVLRMANRIFGEAYVL